MTSKGRLVVAVAVIIMLGVLLALGKITEAAAFGPIGVIVGYVFGDRNGEKRLAAAILNQGTNQPALDAVMPHSIAANPPTSSPPADPASSSGPSGSSGSSRPFG